MIIHTYEICITEQYLLSRGLTPESCVFFDIETTGFRAVSSCLYLIGAACKIPEEIPQKARKGSTPEKTEAACRWKITQWMARQPQEEAALLQAFADFMKPYGTVIHFNGKRFDLPYLEEKYAQYRLPSPFSGKASVDLYLDFRPLKAFLKLNHMNQKSLELFLGLDRDDQYDGGRLIPVYREFCKTFDSKLLELLLLHNKEDVEGMFSLTSLYGYLNFLQTKQICLYTAGELSTGTAGLSRTEVLPSGNGSTDLLFTFRLAVPVPIPISMPLDVGYFTLKESTAKLMLHVRQDTFYYYFPDYKNYYYLPQEDQAVHKSVAAYVDKQYRRPAKAETCYIRQSGAFLPQPEEIFTPALRRSLKDPYTWFAWKEEVLKDTSRLLDYLLAWLRSIR